VKKYMTISIITLSLFLFPIQLQANDMINNSATAYLNGTIHQEAHNGTSNTINIGTIKNESNKNLNSVSVSAIVNGNISLITRDNSATMNIGSYTKK